MGLKISCKNRRKHDKRNKVLSSWWAQQR
uniref:Uncharacterized protein n=1 Tax=Rhizophora mucronata TaxID=61149 RepID=A0A2P2IYI5_RHIMU